MKKPARFQWISAEDYQNRLTEQQWRQVLAAYSFAILPLLFFIQQPLGGILTAAVTLKWLAVWRHWQKLPIYLVIVLFPLGIALIIPGFWRIGLTYSFVNLLSVMSTCKMLESRNTRDSRILFLISQTLALCFLMYTQSIPIFIYLLFTLALSYHTLLLISQRHSRITTLTSWKAISKLILLALPLTAILFFTFPRINPLWGLPRQTGQAITGLPNEMSLGDIGRLAQSNEISFRVQFADNIPEGQKLYWRGPVLWSYNGKQWLQRQGDHRSRPEPMRYDPTSKIQYTLSPAKPDLEWLTGLDLTLNKPNNIRLGYSYQMRMPRYQKQSDARISLTAASQYQLGYEPLSKRDQRDATQLPPGLNIPQTRALAQQLYQQGGQTTEGFARAFMNHIRNNEYYYTLEPYPGSGDVETFLFTTHTGFCEHYANALAISARSLGIPARIIIGYQGGQLNPLSGEFVVREENAHAWVELWQAEIGWTRYDPTAAVAPFRIQSARLSSDELSGTDSRSLGTRLAEKYSSIAWLRNAVDATQTWWQNWVVNLDSQQQSSLLGNFGLGKYGLFIGGLILLTIISTLLWLTYQRRRPTTEDPLAKTARKLLARLGKIGIIRREHESLSDFLRRIAAEGKTQHPEDWHRAADAYDSARYRDDNNELTTSINLLKKIKP